MKPANAIRLALRSATLHAAGIDVMLCGMQSRYERPLIFVRDASLADCSRCIGFKKASPNASNRSLPNGLTSSSLNNANEANASP